MDEAARPTIKGIFVRSHLRALERARGEDGLLELQKRFGKPLSYKNSDDVPISEEVRLLEYIIDLTSPTELSPRAREIEAGGLHFRNFATTPLWSPTTQIFGSNLKFLLMQSSKSAGYVFQGVEFTSEDIGERTVRITMFNNDYPIEHFEGFFDAWLNDAKKEGTVAASGHTRGRY